MNVMPAPKQTTPMFETVAPIIQKISENEPRDPGGEIERQLQNSEL